ncbi:hypothetical protein [Kribbella italica]|uniref:Uncharacterized protein n=1 Tax=Kribbella italica TaxID=1540520 RepID=A0A7W9MZ30_9ACTN|nr:hypothetical protein [Kribbella italica]MBB5841035.1 hypothetical protein [Kribbella italica]
MPPQAVIVSCPGGYDLDLNYGVGPRSGVLAFTLALIGAIFSFVGFALLGTFLLVRSHRRTPIGSHRPGRRTLAPRTPDRSQGLRLLGVP